MYTHPKDFCSCFMIFVSTFEDFCVCFFVIFDCYLLNISSTWIRQGLQAVRSICLDFCPRHLFSRPTSVKQTSGKYTLFKQEIQIQIHVQIQIQTQSDRAIYFPVTAIWKKISLLPPTLLIRRSL